MKEHAISDIKRVLKKHGLKYRKIANLKRAIDDGHPVLLSLYDHWHYSVCYGYYGTYYFVMNPSIGEMGSLRCAVSKKKFKRMWDGWALEIRRHHSKHQGRQWTFFLDCSIDYR